MRTILFVGAMTVVMAVAPLLVSANQTGENVKETNVVKNEEVTFLLDFQVANNEKITSLVLIDDLEDVLEVKKVRVLDKDKNEITEKGTLAIDEQAAKVTWTAKDTGKYFGQKIYLEIEAALKPNVDLDGYYNKDTQKIEIPNIGKILVNDKETPTDKVVLVPPASVPPTISKKIEQADGKEVDSSAINFEEDFVYMNTAQIPTNRKLLKVELYDKLESVLIYKSAKVIDPDKKDITSLGVLKHDPKTNVVSWIANKPEELDGQVLKLQITAQIQNIPELANYLQDGKIVIPNKSVLKINDEDNESNKVTVTPPTIQNKAEKFVRKSTVETNDVSESTTEESATKGSSGAEK